MTLFADRSGLETLKRLQEDLSFNQYDVERKNDHQQVSSPVQTLTSFTDLGLSDALYRGICSMGFQNPSKIQETALPILMENPPTNLMAQSQSGTGKTAAFLLAALTRVDPANKWPQVLIVLPTLELSEQIAKQCEKMLKFVDGISVCHAIKGKILARNTKITDQVVIGTPGKLADWALRHRCFDIKKIRVFVLDEADVMMAETGHYSTCINIHRQLDCDQCQMLLFSATFDTNVKELADVIIGEPFVKITLRRDELNLRNIKHYVMYTRDEREKRLAITNLYQMHSIGQAIIFCKTRAAASQISMIMRELGQNVASLHGDLQPTERMQAIEGFRNGEQKVLVTTNVCSRGIDICQVSLVINYDLPILRDGQPDFDTYYHRIGRTGRFGRPGTAIDLLNSDNAVEMEALERIKEEFDIELNFIDHASLESLIGMDDHS